MDTDDGHSDCVPQDPPFACDQDRGGCQFQIWPLLHGAEPAVAYVAAGYQRCREFDPVEPGGRQQPGQDYCTFRADERHVVAVVADGVGQSFFGNLAARVAGEALVAYLWVHRDAPPAADALKEVLRAPQQALADEVAHKAPSDDLDTFLRAALLETKLKDGSQTVFGAVILDRHQRSADIYLLGDITVIVHDMSPAPWLLSADKHGRWSSANGVKGAIDGRRLEGVEAIVLRSDGAAADWGCALDEVVQGDRFRDNANRWADRDDVSFVAVVAGGIAVPPPAPLPEPPPPPPLDEPPRPFAGPLAPLAAVETPGEPIAPPEPRAPPAERIDGLRPSQLRTVAAGAIGVLGGYFVVWLFRMLLIDSPMFVQFPPAASEAPATVLREPSATIPPELGWTIQPPRRAPELARKLSALRSASSKTAAADVVEHGDGISGGGANPDPVERGLMFAMVADRDAATATGTLWMSCAAPGGPSFDETIDLARRLILLDHRFDQSRYLCWFQSAGRWRRLDVDLDALPHDDVVVDCYVLTITRDRG